MYGRSCFLALLCLSATSGARAGTTETLRATGSGGAAVQVPHDVRLSLRSQYTVEAWVKPASASGNHALITKGQYDFALMLQGGRVMLYEGGQDVTTPEALPVGEWSHIAATFDGVARKIYVDGVLKVTKADSRSVPANEEPLYIGGAQVGWTLSGAMTELRLWSVARRESEIRRDLNKQLSEPEPGLVTAWPLEGSAQDITGEFGGVVGSGSFDGGAAPVLPSGPYTIPRTSSVPNVDGRCTDVGYGWLRLPIYYGTGLGAKVQWARIVAGSTDLYVCVDQMLRGNNSSPWPSVSLYLDVDGDGGTVPTAQDYRISLDQAGSGSSAKGNGAGSYVDAGLTAYHYRVETDGSQEFYWDAEFRVNRSLLPSTDAVFGLQIVHHDVGSTGVHRSWPVGFHADRPDAWAQATISPTVNIEVDAVPPRVEARLLPDSSVYREGSTLKFRAQGYDDGGVASITHFVDNMAVEQCVTPEAPLESGPCEYEIRSLRPGRHFYWARVTDKGGRQGFSDVRTFQVNVDGTPPLVEVSIAPRQPVPGETMTIEARAFDEARVNSVGIYYHGGYHRCTYTTFGSERICRVEATAPDDVDWIRYQAFAWDEEGYEGRSAVRYAMTTGADAPDADGDGLPDALETRLCTSSFDIDSDRDGLSDGWEVLGLDFSDGEFIDLPNLGAAPCQRDVFLQYDYEQGARVQSGVLEPIVASYRRAGVTLHIEENERPRIPVERVREVGALVAAQQKDGEGQYWFDPKRNWTHYYAWGRLTTGRSGAWGRYFTHDAVRDGFLRNASTGVFERDDAGRGVYGTCACPADIDGSTCKDSYPARTPCEREAPDGEAKRFMHETGHSLGLGHGGRTPNASRPTIEGRNFHYGGGWDGSNNKPNYLSVMNYMYNGGLACLLPASDPDEDPLLVTEVDYSSAPYADLNEAALDERATSSFARELQASVCKSAEEGAIPVVLFSCQDPDDEDVYYLNVSDGTKLVAQRSTQAWWSFSALPSHAPGIDWNCDGNIEASVAANINGDGGDFIWPGELCDEADNDDDDKVDEGCGVASGELLRGRSDWDRIPNRSTCNILYNDREERRCYPQVAAYRSAIEGIDCRDPSHADATCAESHVLFSGPPNRIDEERDPVVSAPPSEACNGHDDDGDRQVDEGCRDGDGDKIADGYDNCPETANPLQEDRNRDGLGDACQFPLAVEGLAVASLGAEGLRLVWSAQPDRRGYAIYRSSNADPTLSYLGGEEFPSTRAPTYTDAEVGAEDGTFKYAVHAVNWMGQEGPDRYIEVTIVGGEVSATSVGSDQLDAPISEETDPDYSPLPSADAGMGGDASPTDGDPGGESGCGCRTRTPAYPAWPALVFLFAWLRRGRS